MSKKIMTTSLATAAALAALVTAAPMAAQAQANGVTNCDAPGGRQRPVRGPGTFPQTLKNSLTFRQ